ncbi:exonuclease domain-containing protein [Sediminibacterium sp.]|uniref:exonuclease domain-containing protein n=1 Tax=Sediminibacterium sp. TaxID=1917865 RepID=UPI0025ECC19F|nr:exonuclease domain-containing protein [Sediminibacterium sp.]MBT9484707.1 GIY-YIG nuclease family protein [Sediminibacterium sp.]
MRFAVVDIETTGGFPSQHGITEIAIVLHNGSEVEGVYETLVNPHQPIPPFVIGMTGITNAMVEAAPSFHEVAPQIYNLLKNRVFVAHNVNFDFSFVKHHLKEAGFDLQTPKLCTIRLSRKVFPGFPKYGLGHLCRQLNIEIENRHRAGGDAKATAKVLDLVLQNNGERLVKEMLQKENKEQLMPPNLPGHFIQSLPDHPGVYYFHNKLGKVIYVGKAKNIKKRVVSHFTGLDLSKKRQDFLREIYEISYTECPTEFIAILFESIEIKRLWPAFNKSQKKFEQLWAIYQFEDNRGYLRLAIDKKHKNAQPVQAFSLLADAHRELWKLVREFELHPALCFLDKTIPNEWPDPIIHNEQVKKALNYIAAEKASYIIKESNTAILIEKGKFIGMGPIDHLEMAEPSAPAYIAAIKEAVIPYAENEVIKSMLRKYLERYPHRVVRIME